MSKNCLGNCLICGKCAKLPILDGFREHKKAHEPREGYGIAIDIGTTTVVLALLNLADGNIVARHSLMNPQRMFGADVISRIDAANRGHLREQCSLVKECIANGINELLAFSGKTPDNIVSVAIAGNTTMTYLLLGFPCKSLGISPFQPEFSPASEYNAELLGVSGLNCRLVIFPWLAAFVGGDITSGLLHVLLENTNSFLLIDLGTNGEMALYDNEKLIITSTAAGPAFEQSSGDSVSGASGVISELARLVRDSLLDETGKLSHEDTVFTQKQIRELQLAKSAVRSGLEILIETAEISYADLDAVYLAGGIGQAMVVKDAIEIGLIPKELENKTRAVGNASLGGAVHMLLAPAQATAEIERLLSNVTEVNLAAHKSFNNYFMENMYFGI